jgi:thiosulfate dehydrogenase
MRTPRLRFRTAAALAVASFALALAACGGNGGGPTVANGTTAKALYDPQALPSGPVGASIREGHDIIVNTQQTMKGFVTAKMSCAACHINAGTQPRGGSFIGTYGRFPQWNKRAQRVIALQDRLAECFLYSMNGHPPAYNSKAMISMVAYIAYISRDVPVGKPLAESDRFIVPLPSASPNVAHGQALYAQKCASCHQANGAGAGGSIPPLWGVTSFNDGAGMAHIDRMTGFVRYNMPKNAPGSLSLTDAYDVSAWVLTHARPAFDKKRAIQFPPDPAKYF